jgi:hypothetical protein
MSHEHRTKIANSKILKRLIACGEGELELTPTQASVGMGLLRKVMPDLSATELSGPDGGPIEMTNTRAAARAVLDVLRTADIKE